MLPLTGLYCELFLSNETRHICTDIKRYIGVLRSQISEAKHEIPWRHSAEHKATSSCCRYT